MRARRITKRGCGGAAVAANIRIANAEGTYLYSARGGGGGGGGGDDADTLAQV